MPGKVLKTCSHQWNSFATDGTCQKCAKCNLIRMINVDTREITYMNLDESSK